ncbi:hypothetical protein [Streptomyces sp. NPDC058268]|uniref:hypothetical protein n=1 Tax=Streptomyces sp. NPDC058268 TaxID=3346413 RepID=UPI0036E7A475
MVDIEGGLGLRVPASVAEILDDVLTSETLARMVEDGLIKCSVHLGTGIVTYRLASEVIPVL